MDDSHQSSSGNAPTRSRKAFEEVALERARRLPCVLVSDEGLLLRATGDAASWFADALGQPFAHRFRERALVERLLQDSPLGAEERRFALTDGRRVGLDLQRCSEGWFVALRDVTPEGLRSESLAHRERRDALGGLSTAVARELNDPMSIVQGRLELLLELVGVVDADTTERHLRVALDHARRISATLRNLRLVGQRSSDTLQKLELGSVVGDALALLGPRGERVQVDVEPSDLAIGGDPAVVARVLANTLRTTIEGTARGSVYLHARRKGQAVRLKVHAARSGRAEPVDWPELSIEATLLRSLGGELRGHRVQGAPTFDLTLPLPPATRGRARPTQHKMLIVGGAPFCDDIRSLLDKDGFTFLEARTVAEALSLAPPADAVVCDLLLDGGTSGWGLGRHLLRDRPELGDRILVVTDGPVGASTEPMIEVQKPLSRAGLLDALGRRVRRG